jgi:hypothetical protein
MMLASKLQGRSFLSFGQFFIGLGNGNADQHDQSHCETNELFPE